MGNSRPIYTTDDEISFIVSLAAKKPEAGRRYARMILEKPRHWDASVDAGKVKAAARRVLKDAA